MIMMAAKIGLFDFETFKITSIQENENLWDKLM